MPGSSLNSIPYLHTFSKGLINVFELIKLRGGPLMMPGSSLNSIPYLCKFPGSMHTVHSVPNLKQLSKLFLQKVESYYVVLLLHEEYH